jgi:hypothetical protein
MSRITITYSPERSNFGGHAIREPDGTSCYPFTPWFEVRQGTELLLRAAVRLGLYAAELADNRLKALPLGDTSPAAVLGQLLIRYGVRRMEAVGVKTSVLWACTERNQPGLARGHWIRALPIICTWACGNRNGSGRAVLPVMNAWRRSWAPGSGVLVERERDTAA